MDGDNGLPRVGDVTNPRSMTARMPYLWAYSSRVNRLGRNHTEYWKTFERCESYHKVGPIIVGRGPYHTVGFEWFATWPATRRLRFPFGRRPASPLPWICTRAEMMAGALSETCATVAKMREKITYHAGAVAILEQIKRREVTKTNLRQGWSPFGHAIS